MFLHDRVIVEAMVVLLFAPGCGNDSAIQAPTETTIVTLYANIVKYCWHYQIS
jgi:hypothetical protein